MAELCPIKEKSNNQSQSLQISATSLSGESFNKTDLTEQPSTTSSSGSSYFLFYHTLTLFPITIP